MEGAVGRPASPGTRLEERYGGGVKALAAAVVTRGGVLFQSYRPSVVLGQDAGKR